MTTLLQLISAFIVTALLGCSTPPGDTTNISKTTALVDTPRSFVKNYGLHDTTKLFAFVGEKISVDHLPSKQNSFDNGFKAKYLILKKVYGNFSQDTIEFVAYDHYGMPAFSKFKNVLLYVSADSGTYYHQKYMYNDVYKTKDGRWAGMYASDDYEHGYNRHTKIKPVKIDFAVKVSFPIKTVDEQGQQLEFSFPKPYFKTVGDSAFAVYGNYVEDLFTLKKTGFLTSRGMFEATAEQEEDMVEASQPEPRKTPPSADDLKFLAFWKKFVISLKEPGLKSFRQIALDTLYVTDKLLPIDKFINECFNRVIDNEVRKRIIDNTKLEYTFNDVEFYNLLTNQVKKEIMKVGQGYRLREMSVTRSTKNDYPPTINFYFIETKKGYRLYEIDWLEMTSGGLQCCR
jgi:hypothetical protein